MPTMLAVDTNNDLITRNGNLVLNTQLAATMQACEHKAQAMLTEMVLAYDEGMPNFNVVWNGSPNIAQFEAALRVQLLSVPEVIEVVDITTSIIGDTLSYNAVISTTYGIGALNGAV